MLPHPLPLLFSSPCVPSRCPRLFAAALLLTSSLFLLHHSPLSCRLGLAPAAVVLLSLLECTPNRAWIWKVPPHTHTSLPSPLLPSSRYCLRRFHPTSCLHQASCSCLVSLPFLTSLHTFHLLLFYSSLSLSPSFSVFLTLNVSPTLNSTHSGWATLCEWVALYCMCQCNWKRHTSLINIDSSAWRQASVSV